MKQIIKIVAACLLTLALLCFGLSAFAEELTGTSRLSGSLTAGLAPVAPVDPLDPASPLPPIGNGGTAGALSIDFAAVLDFGKQQISSLDQTYYAKPLSLEQAAGEILQRPNFVQVSDRRGTFSGWQLKVRQKAQFQTAAGQELKGAELTLGEGEVLSTVDPRYAPYAKKAVALLPAATADVAVAAEADQGMGTWVYRFGDETTMTSAIQLKVPGATVKYAQGYHTTLTWQLETTPANDQR